ncbi:MAG: hypothetical protein WBW84_24140 [Acidobacteriaceae bacterium]
MNDLSEAVERLTRRTETLESRVSALEQAPHPQPLPAAPTPSAVTAAPAAAAGPPQQAGVFSVLGKAMLAIAGAYLLRALAESSALPRIPLVVLAIVYAFLWLIPAMRAKAWLSSVAWACTSALILVPMLWELTLRFAFLPNAVTAGLLAAFVIAASALAWKRHFAEVVWVSEAAASLAAVALALATRDLTPFLAALLIVAAAGEVAAARHRTLRVRPLVAAAVDFVLFALIWIYSSPAASRADYPAIGAALLLAFAPLLLLIYASSASTQTLILGRRISFFETAQTLVAFLLAVWGVLAFWSGPGARMLGFLCLIAAAAGYSVAFAGFERASAQRNFHVYATGSLALMLAGCWLLLPAPWLGLSLTLLAVAATLLGVRNARRTLQFHGLAFLFAAAFSSGLLVWTSHALAGKFPASPAWILYIVSVAAMLSYAAVAGVPGDAWPPRALRLLHAALALGAAAALLVWGLVRVVAGAAPAAEHLAVLRTLTGCALAMLLAWSGSRHQHRELIWLAWASLAGLAGKLLFEDMRHGHLGFTAASIFLYALTLLAMPRLVRLKQGPAHQG